MELERNKIRPQLYSTKPVEDVLMANIQVAVCLLTILKSPIVYTRTEWSRAYNGVGSDRDVVFNVLLKSSQYY